MAKAHSPSGVILFYNALDEVLRILDSPDRTKYDPIIHKRCPTPYELARQARNWAQTVAADVVLIAKTPELVNPYTGTVYTRDQMAAAAWWIRNRSVMVEGYHGGLIEVTHADVLTGTSRKATPFWRAAPKGVRGGARHD